MLGTVNSFPVPIFVSVPTAPDELSCLDEEVRETVASYLGGGQVLFRARSLGTDVVTGSKRRTPIGAATDGVFVWALEAAYYVREHGLAPASVELIVVALERSGVCPEVAPVRVAELCAVVRGASAAQGESGDRGASGVDPFV